MKRVRLALVVAVTLLVFAGLAAARPGIVAKLDVPLLRRPRERSGPAALAMVLGFYGADSSRRARTDEAFDVKSGETSLQDLAATAERLGYSARIAEPGIDSLADFLRLGVPPIVCVEPREGAPGKNHFLVVQRWETLGTRYFVLDGGPQPLRVGWSVLLSVWQPGGGRALIVTPKR